MPAPAAAGAVTLYEASVAVRAGGTERRVPPDHARALAGPVRMRAFLDQWQEGRAKRAWGAVALAYAVVVAAGALSHDGDLSALEWALLLLLLGVLLADGLVNVLPAGFRSFKDSVQEAWGRRRGGGDDRLFLAGNVALGLAAAGMAAVVIAYAPIDVGIVALALALSVVMIGALVGRRV